MEQEQINTHVVVELVTISLLMPPSHRQVSECVEGSQGKKMQKSFDLIMPIRWLPAKFHIVRENQFAPTLKL